VASGNRRVEGDPTIPETHERGVAHDEVVKNFDIEQSPCRDRHCRQVKVIWRRRRVAARVVVRDQDSRHASPDGLREQLADADCSWYILHNIIVTVPIWDTAQGNGSGATYHIVGFSGFQITACSGGKDIEGVSRQLFYSSGPTTSDPGTSGLPQALAVQLVR